ncbi:MAG: hypothetical protein M0R31_07975 [Candidatus Riflebacteria bacterium]|nr:hypothetical protein [Candidatus Riflebacteria bacterium]
MIPTNYRMIPTNYRMIPTNYRMIPTNHRLTITDPHCPGKMAAESRRSIDPNKSPAICYRSVATYRFNKLRLTTDFQ